ncbi:TPA: hypothetical protein N0F65_000542 [Lagenidium giganteum]|uniref:Uncharacterized protein n=1 Tax=Lagenidium giganteum TaxID=4803 RepID=A0AAV2Z4J8_9STRA|nr:TPA: hypothetical protein N0F65_000542 [Lagenidium giganteum]
MDLAGDNPFADLMSKAVKLKGHQQAQLRPVFDSWPQYFQHSMFMQESVLSQRCKPFPERFAAAELMKVAGNQHFANGVLEEAVAEYEKALAVFKYCENKDPGWKKKGIEDTDITVVDYKCDNPEDQLRLNNLKVSCYLNIAVCKFKLKEFPICIRACDDTLLLDPRNVKAFYRRALALITPKSSGALEFDQAITDLQQAYNIDPENREVRKLLRELKEQKARQKKLDRDTFSGMFDRGQVYKEEIEGSKGEKPEEEAFKSDEQFQKEVKDAEALARMCESKGHEESAKEIRDKIEQAKVARQRRLKQVDFFNPTPEMIADAEKNGIDLTDPNVQKMLHDLQEEEHTKGKVSFGGNQSSGGGADVQSVDSILKSMTNEQIGAMLTREGIDYHKITDREQFFETARQVLMAKLNEKQATPDKNTYFYTIVLIACAWTLLRLYTTGGLATLRRLLADLLTGETSTHVPSDDTDLFDD